MAENSNPLVYTVHCRKRFGLDADAYSSVVDAEATEASERNTGQEKKKNSATDLSKPLNLLVVILYTS